jgi:hypothetical protein
MLNLISLILLIVAPLPSLALGLLLLSRLPIAVAVGLTMCMFLLLVLGIQYLAAMWLERVRAPAKALEYESSLLSPSSDGSGTTKLDVPFVFGLGVFGHIVCLAGIVAAIFTISATETTSILACGGVLAAMGIWGLARVSKASPFFVPPLIASREGIRSQKYFVPWQDVVNVVVGSGRGRPLYIDTVREGSSYRIGSDGREQPCEEKRVKVPSLGMWSEDAAQYLLTRARLTLVGIPSDQPRVQSSDVNEGTRRKGMYSCQSNTSENTAWIAGDDSSASVR